MSTENPYDTPQQASPGISTHRRQLTLKRIDVLSAATMLGALYLVIGLIVGAMFAVLALVGVAANGGGPAVFTGLGAIIVLPLMYGILGFIGGAICAFVYNIVAGMAGGVKLEFE